MKGRRKLKTNKWQLKAKFETEARKLLGSRSFNQSRFLNIALQKGKEMEPVGRLAG